MVNKSPVPLPLDLAQRICSGDAAAENEFAEVFWHRVFRMAVARTGDRELACDIAQETILASLQSVRAGQLHDRSKLAAFVCGVARHLLSNQLRANWARHEEQISADLQCGSDSDSDSLEDEERLNALQHALRALTRTERHVLEMTLVNGFKPAQIALSLGLTPEVVRAHKLRGRKKVMERVQRKLSLRVVGPH